MSRRSGAGGPGVGRYLAGRIGQTVLVLWGAHAVSFVLLYLLPSDAVTIKLMGSTGLEAGSFDPQTLATAREELGVDSSIWSQYVANLGRLLHGDLGISYQRGTTVSSLLGEALPHTLLLAGSTIVLAVVLGIGLGAVIGYVRRPGLREALLAVPPLAVSVPAFAIGLVLIQVFAFRLRVLPSSGTDGLSSLVLPTVALAVPLAAPIAQVFAKGLLSSLDQPYIDTVFAKGASRTQVLRHAVLNSISPTLALVGVLVGGLIGGAVITETVFTREGIGTLTVSAVQSQDLPVVQAIVLISAAAYALATLLVDVLHPVIDKRVAHARATA